MSSSDSSEDLVPNIEVEHELVGVDVGSSIHIEEPFRDEAVPKPKRTKVN